MATTQVIATCDCCGADGPLDDEHGYCVRCAADWSGWEKGRRMMALLGVAMAVDTAVDSSAKCSPEQVRAIVEVTLAKGGYFEDDAIALVDPPTDAVERLPRGTRAGAARTRAMSTRCTRT